MPERTTLPPSPKPWAGARLMKQNRKSHTRRHWTVKRWQRYHAEREQRRERQSRPYLKETRLRREADQARYEKRRARIAARHETRRAAMRAEIEDLANLIVRSVLDNLDAVQDLMRGLGMIEIAPGHWRSRPAPPEATP